MRLFQGMDTSASALLAERLRMDVIASNLANQNSTRSASGGAYRRLMVSLAARETLPRRQHGTTPAAFGGVGVQVTGVSEDQSPLPRTYDPSHPDADAEGYVSMPNVNPVHEMVDLITAVRAYEANVTVLNAAKQMAMNALEIGKA